jgi:hypothetical protein
MKIKTYRRWNWEFDHGIDELSEAEARPLRHAVAFYDQHNRLYRVELREADGTEGNVARMTTSYDYYCAHDGRVLQKRSIGERGEVSLIVDMDYTDTDVTETAWWPESNVSKSIRRRLTERRQGASDVNR